jgi:hypothetical protein
MIITNSGLVSKYRNRLHDDVHTWHGVFSHNGSWYGTLHLMTENEPGVYFVENSTNHSLVHNPFNVSESSPFVYGLIVSEQDDFNMLYSLTLTQQLAPDPTQSNSRICVYLIGAKAAADPMIMPISFHGNTTCKWQTVESRGENFWVQ